MAKAKAKRVEEAEARRIRRQVARLERRLDELIAQEARRSRKLSRTQERVRAIQERLTVLHGASATEDDPPGGDPPAARPSVAGYCLRERRRVTLVDAMPVTLRNGRSALAGTCPDCGARIVSMARPQA